MEPPARAVRASELVNVEVERWPTGDDAADQALGGGLASGFSVLLWGGPGAGKSRLALRWVSRMGPALVISLEMAAELTVFSATDAGADLGQLHVTTELEGWEAEAERIGARAVLLDSASALEPAAARLEMMRELACWARRCRGVSIAISHQNRRGRALGHSGLEYWPDTTLRARAARRSGWTRVRIAKCRFAPLGSFEVPIAAISGS